MPQLPLPQRGQPLDVSYVYQMASTINDLVVQVAPTASNNVKIKPATGSASSVPTASAAIYCETKSVATNRDVVAGATESFNIDFNFKLPPVIVATPWNKDANSPDVNIFITSVTNSRATLVAKFASNGKANVDVNVIAIGIPN